MATTYQIVYWRAIPAQVKAKAGRERVSKTLSDRFQVAIDDAAMRAGMIGSDDYLAEWRNAEAVEQEGDPETVATALITALEAEYPDARLKMLVENWGRDL